ncbi:hypothetical protein HDU98_003208 [Podochytrium sp. JEL0797]|nr:hypothetical protein HDU98_003208 [Podochytrium sp. JEL0797]
MASDCDFLATTPRQLPSHGLASPPRTVPRALHARQGDVQHTLLFECRDEPGANQWAVQATIAMPEHTLLTPSANIVSFVLKHGLSRGLFSTRSLNVSFASTPSPLAHRFALFTKSSAEPFRIETKATFRILETHCPNMLSEDLPSEDPHHETPTIQHELKVLEDAHLVSTMLKTSGIKNPKDASVVRLTQDEFETSSLPVSIQEVSIDSLLVVETPTEPLSASHHSSFVPIESATPEAPISDQVLAESTPPPSEPCTETGDSEVVASSDLSGDVCEDEEEEVVASSVKGEASNLHDANDSDWEEECDMNATLPGTERAEMVVERVQGTTHVSVFVTDSNGTQTQEDVNINSVRDSVPVSVTHASDDHNEEEAEESIPSTPFSPLCEFPAPDSPERVESLPTESLDPSTTEPMQDVQKYTPLDTQKSELESEFGPPAPHGTATIQDTLSNTEDDSLYTQPPRTHLKRTDSIFTVEIDPHDGTFDTSALTPSGATKVKSALEECRRLGRKWPQRVKVTREVVVKKGSGRGGIVKKEQGGGVGKERKSVLGSLFGPWKSVWSGLGFSQRANRDAVAMVQEGGQDVEMEGAAAERK